MEQLEIKNLKTKKYSTILENLKCIIDLIENYGLNDDLFKKGKDNIDFVRKKLKLTKMQVVLFAIFIENYDNSHISIKDFSISLKCKKIDLLIFTKDIDALEKKRIIRCRKSTYNTSYRVPKDVIEAISKNNTYKSKSPKVKNEKELFCWFHQLFTEKEYDEISTDELLSELRYLLENNSSLSFCKQINIFCKTFLNNDNNFLFLMYCCHKYINLDLDLYLGDMVEVFDDYKQYKDLIYNITKSYNNELFLNNILEFQYNNGLEDKTEVKITDKAKNLLFVDVELIMKRLEGSKNIIIYSNIHSKQLYFNKREKDQIEKLSLLLKQEEFSKIQQKLDENGMRKGFACLFYGEPGTGKTETVYQIAKSTGRNIFMVDISESKSKWFGESERRIKGVFDNYKKYLNSQEHAPILLFNEADAILGTRKEAMGGTIDQTENTIQNIILQEMENFEGIMIATTNLAKNFDKAFERRFLYKIGFDKPNLTTKEKIWKEMLPSLSKNEIIELAENFDLSGGEIENVVRKYTIECILSNVKPTIEIVRKYCKTERLKSSESISKIGF